MKKLLSIILSLSLLLVIACGCDDNTDKDKNKEESKPTTSSTQQNKDDTSSTEDISQPESNTETIIQTIPADTTDDSQDENSSETEEEFDPDKDVRERMRGGVNFQGCEGGMPEKMDSYMYQREYYDLVAEAGFNNIRLPVGLAKMIVSEAPEYLLDTEQLRRLDIAINHALDAGLIIAIDNHGTSFDYREQELFVRGWQQIAERYRYYPSELIFELINEPSGGLDSTLNDNQMAALDVIRKTNPTRNIVLAPNEWNGYWKLWDVQTPRHLNENGQIEFDNNIILAVHMYNPMSFTHQGGMSETNHEEHITGDPKEYLSAITSALEVCADYEKRTGKTVWVNEWGAFLSHKQDDCMQTYYKYTTSEMKRLDLAYAVWEFSSGFGIYDMKEKKFKDYIVDNMEIEW